MKISNRGILELRQALIALDGLPTPTSLENRNAQTYLKPYDFTGTVRFRIGKTLNALKPIAEAIEKAGDAVTRKYAVDNIIPGPMVSAYTTERTELMDVENEIDIPKLTEADLKLDVNPIPGSVLSILSVMM